MNDDLRDAKLVTPVPSSKGMKECARCGSKDFVFAFVEFKVYNNHSKGSIHYTVSCNKCKNGIVKVGSIIKAMKFWNTEQDRIIHNSIIERGW